MFHVKMGSILKYAIVLLIADSTMVNFRVLARAMSTVAKSFEAHQVVPDVIPKAPGALAYVKYPSGVEVKEGNVLTPTQVKDLPTIEWDAASDKFYTVIMTGLVITVRCSQQPPSQRSIT